MKIVRYRTPELANWSPMDRLSSFRDLMDSAFQLAASGSGLDRVWSPPMDVHEDGEQLTVKLELAGMKKEDFDISLENDLLTISGERKVEREQREGESFRSERFHGSFSRTVSLPSPVKADKVSASYKDGILTVVLPKAEEAKPKKIQVSLN